MIDLIKELFAYRELLWNITLRELKVKYKNSALGFLWALIEPLMTILLYMIIFSVIVKIKVPNYPVFLLSAVLPWLYLQRSLNGSVNVFYKDRVLIKKVYFPRTLLPLGIILTYLINFLLTLLVFSPVLLYFKMDELKLRLLLLPLVILAQTLFIIGLCLLASLANAFFQDVGYALQVITRFWFYACPILYSIEMVKKAGSTLYHLYMLNPMAVIIELYRYVLLGYPPPEGEYLVTSCLFIFLILLAGAYLFVKYENSMVKQA